MGEVDLRQLRYFVAVAEERNFTRAADRLLMTQPALSRAIRALENAVGTQLLVRRYRDVTPTAAGQVLLQQGRSLEEQMMAAIRLARRAATTPPGLRVTALGGDVVVLDKLVSSHNLAGSSTPALAFAVDHEEQTDQLRDGRADIGLVRAPFDDRGLDGEELFSEPRVVLLPAGHPLASQAAVELAQLTDLPVVRWRGQHGDAVLAWPPDVAGRAWVAGPGITDTAQLHALARLGHGTGFIPESVARTGPFAGVRAVRVIDAPLSTLRIAWMESSTSLAVADFVRHAVETIGSRSPAIPVHPVKRCAVQ